MYAISFDGTLHAYDAAGETGCTGTPKTCEPLWTAAAGTKASPVIAAGSVYAMDGSGLVRVFDAEARTNCSGNPAACTPLWTAQVDPPGGSAIGFPAAANGRVYAGNAVFDAAGVTNCSGTPTVCDPLWLVSAGGRFPVVANGIEFAGGGASSGGGSPLPLHAFDATGEAQCSRTPRVCAPLWTTNRASAVTESPAVQNGVLYLVTRGDPSSLSPGTLHAYTQAPTAPTAPGRAAPAG